MEHESWKEFVSDLRLGLLSRFEKGERHEESSSYSFAAEVEPVSSVQPQGPVLVPPGTAPFPQPQLVLLSSSLQLRLCRYSRNRFRSWCSCCQEPRRNAGRIACKRSFSECRTRCKWRVQPMEVDTEVFATTRPRTTWPRSPI